MPGVIYTRSLTPRDSSLVEVAFLTTKWITAITDLFRQYRYRDAGEALRRKQDKEREAAGLPPVQRLGARAAAQRGGRGAGPPSRGRGGGAPPSSGGGGPGGSRSFHQPDKNLYVHLLGHLRKKNLLPVVIFTFSKRRCEENAGTLTNQDLCTSGEKSEVHVTIEKALSRLKGKLPFPPE